MTTASSGSLTGPGRILVVDDEDVSRRLVKNVLEGAGHRVTEAMTGEQALEIFPAAAPDVILLDVVMPGINGFEVCRRLKNDAKTAGIPVLMITSLNEREDRLSGIRAGANDFLIKPIDREEILLRVRNALQSKRLLDQVHEDYRQLRRLQDLRDNLTHLIVHDMREPLAMVRLELEIQKRFLSEQEGVSERKQLDAACEQVSALVEMANSLLDVSRLEQGKLRLSRAQVDLVGVALEAVDSLQTLAGSRRVLVESPQGPARAFCQEYLIRRAVTNLIANAIRSTGDDGVIRVAVTVAGGRVRVAVDDNGPGLPPEDQAVMFEKFGRSAGLAVSGGAGGIGLAFCRLVAEAHGGQTGVESELGQGATLWIEVPQEEPRGEFHRGA